jgi:hypothetical protein
VFLQRTTCNAARRRKLADAALACGIGRQQVQGFFYVARK